MEEVWKDINLATLNEQNRRPTTTHPMNLGGVMFQDFLGNIDPPNTIMSSVSSQSESLYCPPAPSPAPQLVTALSLSSRPNFHLTNKPPSVNSKRFPQPHSPDCALGDRRNKRMIKNRESAARSRARKQAYTNELELEVAHLKEENARLRRKQQQLSEAAASEQKKKGTLCRASTAPF